MGKHATVLVVKQADGLTVWIEEFYIDLKPSDPKREMTATDVKRCEVLAKAGVNEERLDVGRGIRFMVDWSD